MKENHQAGGGDPVSPLVLETALAAFGAVFFLFLMEWLFFTTKYSFFRPMPWPGRILILAASPLLPGLFLMLITGLLGAAAMVWKRALAGLPAIPVAFVLACSGLLMIDNFTITVFDVGTRSYPGTFAKVAYACIFLSLVFGGYVLVRKTARRLHRDFSRKTMWIAAAVCLLAFGAAAWLAHPGVREDAGLRATAGRAPVQRPNILLLGADGVSADHMSLYGYSRQTTPFLTSLVNGSLLCVNAHSDSGSSYVSLTSLLSGKMPKRTGVVEPQYILLGRDAYEHLPGLLHAYGYRSMQIAFPEYADAHVANMRNGFDWMNFRASGTSRLSETVARAVGQGTAYFYQQVWGRLSERLAYISSSAPVLDPFAEIMHRKKETYGDKAKVLRLFDFIDKGQEPFFVHVHFMVTHDKSYRPRARLFSAGKVQDRIFMDDFYDDAIWEFDRDVKRIFHFLAAENKLDRTVIIIYSDHGWMHKMKYQVPLLFHFPQDACAGRIQGPAHNVDIVPTLLDYMGVPPPDWLDGHSLLAAADCARQ